MMKYCVGLVRSPLCICTICQKTLNVFLVFLGKRVWATIFWPIHALMNNFAKSFIFNTFDLLYNSWVEAFSRISNFTMCSDRSMEVSLPALIENQDRPTDQPTQHQPTDQQTDKRAHREVTLPNIYTTINFLHKWGHILNSLHAKHLLLIFK